MSVLSISIKLGRILNQPLQNQKNQTRRFWISSIVLGFFLLASNGCGINVWDDRDGTVARNIRIDSLQFVPSLTRFVLADSITPIRFRGMHLGFTCSEILSLGLDSNLHDTYLILKPTSKIKLPAEPSCPVDTSSHRDTVIDFKFKSLKKPFSLVLHNSLDSLTNTAFLIRGKIFSDTLNGVLDSSKNVVMNSLVFHQDSLGSLKNQLHLENVSSCTFLNTAKMTNKGDTVQIRYTWISQDSSTAQDLCHTNHSDSIFVSIGF